MTPVSSIPCRPSKPNKPSKNFPLFAHAAGQWAKKVNGKLYYFGIWDKPQDALQKWNQRKAAIINGTYRKVVSHLDGSDASQVEESQSEFVDIDLARLTIEAAVNLHLEDVSKRIENGDLSPRTKIDRKRGAKFVIEEFGKDRLIETLTPDDWSKLRDRISKGRTAAGTANLISRIQAIMNWLKANEYVKELRWGTCFKKPSRRHLRNERRPKELLFDASEIRKLIEHASEPMRAMILLGINCGLGNAEVSRLQWSHLDLKAGWLDYPRFKTSVDRRAKLWPETVAAIEAWRPLRNELAPQPGKETLVFVTSQGNAWTNVAGENCSIRQQFSRLETRLKIKKPKRGFYSLRRMVETIGGRAKDPVAVNALMGHVDDSMAGVYRLDIEDSRLEAVAEVIRTWLEISTLEIFLKLKLAG